MQTAKNVSPRFFISKTWEFQNFPNHFRIHSKHFGHTRLLGFTPWLPAYDRPFYIFVIENHRQQSYELLYTKYCKFMLGVPKNESTTLVLGQIGRYPVPQKAIRHTILLWHRMEMGTDNILLQKALKFAESLVKRKICEIPKKSMSFTLVP